MNREERTDGGASNYLVYDFVKATAALPGLLWMRPKILYASEAAREKLRGGVLLISNHAGFLDPVCLMIAIWYRRHHFVCLKEFYKGRVSRWLFTQFHCIPIDRENFSMESLRTITGELQRDHLVTMFPEGHVTSGEGLSPFKSGMVLLSMRSGKPLVPVYMRKRKHWYSRVVLGIGERVDVRAELGERPSQTAMNEMTARLQKAEEELAKLVG